MSARIAAGGLSFLGGVAASVGKAELKRQARRLISEGKRMLGINARTTKFKRMTGQRLPLYQKGHQRVAGFYGRFKPTFGKELKFFDTIIDNFSTVDEWKPLHGLTVALNTVGRGTAPNERIGRNFTLRTLQYKFKILKDLGADEFTYRVVIVLDHQANGELPTKEDIWLTPGPGPSAWHSPRNLENISRFEFLWDKTYTLNAFTGNQSKTSTADSYYKKITIKTEMSGTAGPSTITDIKDNSITMWACLSTPSFAARTTGTFRIRFTG